MFYASRNPNYLGEMLLYSGFAMVTGNWMSYGILVSIWTFLFWPSMLMKDGSLMKKRGWNEYRQHSYMLLPRVFRPDVLNNIMYAALVLVFALAYYMANGMILMRMKFDRG